MPNYHMEWKIGNFQIRELTTGMPAKKQCKNPRQHRTP